MLLFAFVLLQIFRLVALMMAQLAGIAVAIAFLALVLLEVFLLVAFVPFLHVFFASLVITVIVITIVVVAAIIVSVIAPALRVGNGTAAAGRDPTLEAYVCGPPPMVDAVLPVLQKIGVDADNIHLDKFTPASK